MDFFKSEIKIIDNFIKESLKNNFYEIDRAIKYSLFTGGKRLRPVLSLVIGENLGLKIQDILPFAVAIEYLHTASLIHDDLPIMDNDDLRRGKPSVHKKFSNETALLSGDIMITEAMKIILKHDYENSIKTELLELLVKTWGSEGISGGQALEKEKERIKEINPLKIFKMKTGALFGASFLGPAIIYKMSDTKKTEYYFTGLNIGMVYQINDDIADMDDKSYNITHEFETDFIMEYKEKTIRQIRQMIEKIGLKTEKIGIILNKIIKEE